MFTQVIIRKRKTDGLMDVWRTDVQGETIIPRHYCVAGYKNTWPSISRTWLPTCDPSGVRTTAVRNNGLRVNSPIHQAMGAMGARYFTSFLTLFKSYLDNGRVIMKDSVQWRAIWSWAEISRDSNPWPHEPTMGVIKHSTTQILPSLLKWGLL